MGVADLRKRLEISKYMKQWSRAEWFIDDEGRIDVQGTVNISGFKENVLPIKFGHVKGNFIVSHSKINTMENFPYQVNGYLLCNRTEIENLEHMPKTIGGLVSMADNKLKTLENTNETIHGDVDFRGNAVEFTEEDVKKNFNLDPEMKIYVVDKTDDN